MDVHKAHSTLFDPSSCTCDALMGFNIQPYYEWWGGNILGFNGEKHGFISIAMATSRRLGYGDWPGWALCDAMCIFYLEYIYIYLYVYKYTYIHTYIHTHIYIYICICYRLTVALAAASQRILGLSEMSTCEVRAQSISILLCQHGWAHLDKNSQGTFTVASTGKVHMCQNEAAMAPHSAGGYSLSTIVQNFPSFPWPMFTFLGSSPTTVFSICVFPGRKSVGGVSASLRKLPEMKAWQFKQQFD